VGDFLRVLLDSIEYLWPFRMVHAWERGIYLVCGRATRSVGAGVWPVIPWFTDVVPVIVKPSVYSLPRQSVGLADGSTLTYQAIMTVCVDDVVAAYTELAHYVESVQEITMGLIAERLSEMDTARLAPDGRRKLSAAIRQSLNAELRPYGVRCIDLQFAQWVQGARVYRHFQDIASSVGQFDG
jgi:regulator of protease activity HflC (stomatin/prohibitin superfamily)